MLPPLGGVTDVVAGDSVATLRVKELAVKPTNAVASATAATIPSRRVHGLDCSRSANSPSTPATAGCRFNSISGSSTKSSDTFEAGAAWRAIGFGGAATALND